ncbi:MAG: preprotein translocase subunit SecE [Aquificota bacterium]|nr:MAG: preprotein translocase subunit SecE [Aquificota bacterium]
MGRFLAFLKSARQELDRVSWPDRKLVIKATVSVIIFSLLLGVSLWVFDLAFTRLVHFILSLRG